SCSDLDVSILTLYTSYLYSTSFTFFFLIHRHPPRSTLFPYTTLFRSVHDDRQVRGPALEVVQLAVEGLRLGDVGGRADQVRPAGLRVRLHDAHGEWHEVLGEHDADDVVRRAVIHREARVLALAERLDHLVGRRGELDGGHVEARRHHFVHPRVREREDAE